MHAHSTVADYCQFLFFIFFFDYFLLLLLFFFWIFFLNFDFFISIFLNYFLTLFKDLIAKHQLLKIVIESKYTLYTAMNMMNSESTWQ